MKKLLKAIISAASAAAMLFACLLPTGALSGAGEGNGSPAKAPSQDSVDVSGDGYASVLYDSSNGLPTSDANTIIQTSDGFIWIGSYSGLIRYDGNSFYRYDASSGIPSTVSLFEDSSQRLWIGTNDMGIAHYKDGSFTFYSTVEGLKSLSIRSVAEDRDGNIIIATTQGMAYLDTQNTMHLLDDAQLNSEYICELRTGTDGVIYGETLTGSVFTLDGLKVTSFYGSAVFSPDAINCICPDPAAPGFAYIGTSESKVIRGDLSGGMNELKTFSVAPLVKINHISVIDEKVWITADNGIGYLNQDGTVHILDDIPMNNSIDTMIRDSEGNLWFTSSRQGVMKISPSRFTDISHQAGIEKKVTNTTCLHDGELYVGTDSGLYIIDKNGKTKETKLTSLLENVRIRCIKEDSKGNVWLCTYSDNGLVCLKRDGEYITFNEENSGFASNRVRVCEELSDGRMAVSVSGGVYFIDNFSVRDSLTGADGLSNTEILTICEGDNGIIYLGSDGDGIYVLNGSSITRIARTEYPPNADDDEKRIGIHSNVILRIKKQQDRGIYWIVTSNSISYMRGDDIKTLIKFPYSNNFDIFFDDSGRAWVLSSNGIYIASVDQLIEDTKPEYIFYDTKCGLPAVATANSRSCVNSDGELYISSTIGVVRVNIFSHEGETDDIRLSIPFIDIDGKLTAVKNNDMITIPSDCQRLIIYPYALTYSLRNPRISYKLSGFDKEEMTLLRQDLAPVSYTNLDGGTYQFTVGLMNTLTGEVEQTVYVTIVKELAFKETPWFYAAIILGTGIIVFAAVFIYTRKKTAALLKKQAEKQMLIDEMIRVFAKCIDMKDKYTNGHSFRVAMYSKLLAEKMGYDETRANEVYNAAMLHDIGKISIPDSVLNKNGKPTDEEYAILKTHAANGYEVLKEIKIAPELAAGAGYHHERLDGKGYPNGLKGDEIPEIAQIIAVADTFDAMYSTRPYRKQMDIHEVLNEMVKVSGTQLNGDIVNDLVQLVDDGKIQQTAL